MKLISSTRDFAIAGGFGALIVAFELSIGIIITSLTGLPILIAIVDSVLLAYMIMVPPLITRKAGIITATVLVMSLLSVPTSAFGVPGPYKILVFVPLGIIMDILFYASNGKKLLMIIGIIAAAFISVPYQFFLMQQLGLPLPEGTEKLLLPVAIFAAVEGALGVWLAYMTYEKKLKKLSVVKRLQG
ncbi:hypothetical protein HYV82_03500 [Candidatus Woesearchaeota archaeon]|nr:hypothetical protein [Candidatus Woesearchaeota archaeon]